MARSTATADRPSGTERHPVLALDVGGTHVTGALVAVDDRRVVPRTRRDRALDPQGTAAQILGAIVACARDVLALRARISEVMGVAMPGPFDYEAGIAHFADVGKFDSLADVDVRATLLDALSPRITRARFVNDADAFAIGEWTAGAAWGHDRAVGITIGSGIGSGFLDAGQPVESGPTVPPAGRALYIIIDGTPLEERVSRRAIIRAAAAYPSLSAGRALDVREVAEAARAGQPQAAAIFDEAFTTLGRGLGPWLARFEASILVVGGSIAASWDLVEPPLLRGLERGELPWRGPVVRPLLGASSALVGAAGWTRAEPVANDAA